MTTTSEHTEMLTTAERYEHILSVAETQICAEAYKTTQYEAIDSETAADARSRWSDWAVLLDAISDGLMDELHERYCTDPALIRGAA